MNFAPRSHSWRVASLAAAACGALAVLAPAGSPASAAEPKPPRPGAHEATTWGDDSTKEGAKASAGTGSWLPLLDNGSLTSTVLRTGAYATWLRRDAAGAPVTGTGITVALIDTGVARVPGLDTPGKVVNGPDLSYDGQSPATRYTDGYGHGTHLAGVIAGLDKDASVEKVSSTGFIGVAPGASILNMKVAAADGGADVTQVIAAIDWVVQHRRDNGMNVRVISLAYGTHSTQPAAVDPLAKAVENAWKQGIVVVAAAGNDGIANPVLMPAADPYVVTVGAVDHEGTATTSDDAVALFSNGGTAERRPDVLAPGKSVVSLRVPGSFVDNAHPEGLVTGDPTRRFFRGSGTSQATAVVAGEVALLLQARPTLTPDQVKALLRSTATALTDAQPAMGAGVVNIAAAVAAPLPGAGAVQSWTPSTGLGTLDATRGGENVVDPTTGLSLTGQRDALGAAWNAAAWAATSARGAAWTDGTWNGRAWTGAGWEKNGFGWSKWTGTTWSGDSWQARSWRSDSWAARSWRAESWEARSWRGFY